MKSVQRYDAFTVVAGAVRTNEGYLVDTPVVTRTGIFEYSNPDGSIRREYRPPEEVLSEDSLASYKGKPITIRHPKSGRIDVKNVKDEMVGVIMDCGQQVWSDMPAGNGDIKVKAPIIIYQPDRIKDNKELSLGYRLDLDETPGMTPNGEPYDAIQRNIRINHLSAVPVARAGSIARLNIDGDGELSFDASPDNPKEPEKQAKEREDEKRMEKFRIDGIDYEAAPEVINFIKKETERADAACQKEKDACKKVEDAEKCKKDLKGKMDAMTAERDTLKSKVDAFPEELKKAKLDAVDEAVKAVEAKAELVKVAASHKVDGADKMSEKEIKIAVVKAVRGDALDFEGKSDEYINAAFDLCKEETTHTDSVAKQREATKGQSKEQHNDEDDVMACDAREKMIEQMKNAYKGGKE